VSGRLAWMCIAAVWMAASAAGQGTVPPVPPGSAIDLDRFTYVRGLPSGPAGMVALRLDPAALAHSRGPADDEWPPAGRGGFSDVRVIDDRARQLPYIVECRDEPLSIPISLQRVVPSAADLKSTPGHSRSTYLMALPYAHLPIARLALETSARVFQRSVRLAIEHRPDRHRREPWSEVMAAGDWTHADDTSAAPRLVLYLPTIDRADVLLAVDEGDNSPLPIASATLLLPSCALRFYRPEGEALRVVYGNREASSPQYDLSLVAPQTLSAPAQEMAPGPETELHDARRTALVSPRIFWTLLAAAVVILLGLTARLLFAARP
jgi:hypothetical protein